MKKLVVFLLLLLWPAMAARGETWTVETGEDHVYYIETFGEILPEKVQQVLVSTPFAGDAGLCGVLVNGASKIYPDINRQMLLLALNHEGTYGYVRMADVTEYTTLLSVKYGVNGVTY